MGSWKDEKQEDHWRWSVGRSDFDRLLGIHEDRLNLWGSWTTIAGRQEEAVHINSALVTPGIGLQPCLGLSRQPPIHTTTASLTLVMTLRNR